MYIYIYIYAERDTCRSRYAFKIQKCLFGMSCVRHFLSGVAGGHYIPVWRIANGPCRMPVYSSHPVGVYSVYIYTYTYVMQKSVFTQHIYI